MSCRQTGRCYLFINLVESRKTTLFCSDFWIRASFGYYYGEMRFSKAFLHNFTEIMLFQLDLSRNPHKICSSNKPLGESPYIIAAKRSASTDISPMQLLGIGVISHNEDVFCTMLRSRMAILRPLPCESARFVAFRRMHAAAWPAKSVMAGNSLRSNTPAIYSPPSWTSCARGWTPCVHCLRSSLAPQAFQPRPRLPRRT